MPLAGYIKLGMCQYLYMAIEKEKRTTKKARVATLLQVAELQSQGITVDGMHYTVTWPSEENEFVRWDVLAARLAHSPQSETLGVLVKICLEFYYLECSYIKIVVTTVNNQRRWLPRLGE
ncbi:hypothetical protein ACROYT_G014416 [Oculina patagonica]